MEAPARVRRLWAWIVLGVVVLASVGALVSFDGSGPLQLDDLDLLADPGAGRDPIDRQLQWALAFANGAPADRDDLNQRFAPTFLDDIPVDELLQGRDSFVRDAPYRSWAVVTRRTDLTAVVLVGRSGATYELAVSIEQATGRIDGLSLFRQDVNRRPIGRTALALAIAAALALAIAGTLHTWRRRADERTGPWLLGTALVCVAQVAAVRPGAWAMSVALAAGPLTLAACGWMLVRLVPSLAARWTLRGAMVAATLAGVAGHLAVPLPDDVVPPSLQLGPSRSWARALLEVRSVVAVAVALGLAVALALVLLRRPVRRHVPLAAAGLLGTFLLGVVSATWLARPHPLRLALSPWLDATVLALAVAAGLGLLVERWELGGVARLVTDLGDGHEPVALEELVGRALDDPSVELWFWSVELGGYVAIDGRRGDPERPVTGRVATRLSARGEPLAIVVHDAALGIADHRVAAVCAAARMALDNERLQAQVRAQLAETRASRARIVLAADEARREVERNLHDGAQQRLLAVLVNLRRAEARYRRSAVDDRPGEELVGDVGRSADELAVALEELRAIARGLHPPALDHGLAAALDTLAETAPLPVEVDVADGLPSAAPAVDAAVYFFVAEALTNTVRHAGATHLAVTVSPTMAGVRVVATDDGGGGATLARGSGLARLADRAAALGGTMQVDTSAAGTTLVLDLPCEAGTTPEGPSS